MHKPLLLFIALLLCLASSAQNPKPEDIEKLLPELKQSKADTARVRLLLQIGKYYMQAPAAGSANKEQALHYFEDAEKLSIKLAFTEGTGLSYQNLAQAYANKNEWKQAGIFLEKALSVFKSNQLTRDLAESFLLREEFYARSGGTDLNIRIRDYEYARVLFHQAGAREREAATLKILGDFYQLQGNFQTAFDDLKQALVLYKTTPFSDLQGLYDLLNAVSTQLGNYKEGVNYGLQALRAATLLKDSSMQLCAIYNHLGLTSYYLVQYPQAKMYWDQSLAVAKRCRDTSAITTVVLNTTDLLMHMNKLKDALGMLTHFVREYPKTDLDTRIRILCTFINIYAKLKQINEAKPFCDDLLKVYRSPNFPADESKTVLSALLTYFATARQFNQARSYLAKYMDICRKEHFIAGITGGYKTAFKIDSAQKKYAAAIADYQMYTHLKDSVFDAKDSKQIEELKIKYETEKKEKDIAFFKKDSLLQHEKVKQADLMQNLTFGGLFILLIFISLLYYSYRINQRKSLEINNKNSKLGELLTEKEWLLKEIHHRVKNNLQIVMGLLQRQSAYINNEEALAAIQNSENRMHSIALIHQKLYQSENLDLISMPEYIDELIGYLKDSADIGSRVYFEKDIDDIFLDVAQAVPLGLILNEAITNAIKYAYLTSETGIILVSLRQLSDDQNLLIIQDHGPGLKAGFDLNKIDSLGMNLMKGLSKQLGGTFELMQEAGVTIRITFKTEKFVRAVTEERST